MVIEQGRVRKIIRTVSGGLYHANQIPQTGKVDDVRLYADSSRVADLNRDLVATVEWAGDWAMEFNVAKCNVMHFGPGTASDTAMSVSDEVHLHPVVQTARDLGVSFTSNLKFCGQAD